MKLPLNVTATGDIHLGHHRTPTTKIIKSVKDILKSSAELEKLDLLILEGDVFDKPLYLSALEIGDIQMFVGYVLRRCKNNNVILRVLEGTPSHDRNQSKIFVDINELMSIGCNVKYIDSLDIEYIEELDLNILYVPDEWRPDPEDTWKEVLELLSSKGLKKVDLAAMHGMFDYQLPPNIKLKHHLSSRYESIVNYFIFIGHIHQQSKHGKILAPGSIERLMHGDEDIKGYYRVTINGLDDSKITFVENKNATIYKTIDVRGLETDAILAKALTDCSIEADANYRLLGDRGSSLPAALNILRKEHKEVSWSTKTEKPERVISDALTAVNKKFNITEITPLNLKSICATKMTEMDVDPSLSGEAMKLIDTFLESLNGRT